MNGNPPGPGASIAHLPHTGRVVVLCTGNATRSVLAEAAIRARLAWVDVTSAGTLALEGFPLSWRTRAAFDAVGLPIPAHRSRQAHIDDLDAARLVVALAPEHVRWVRRTHPPAAAKTATLLRLGRELTATAGATTFDDAVAQAGWSNVALADWEDVFDPGGMEVDAYIRCAEQIVAGVEAFTTSLAQLW